MEGREKCYAAADDAGFRSDCSKSDQICRRTGQTSLLGEFPNRGLRRRFAWIDESFGRLQRHSSERMAIAIHQRESVADDRQHADAGYPVKVLVFWLHDQKIGHLAIGRFDQMIEENIEHAVRRHQTPAFDDWTGSPLLRLVRQCMPPITCTKPHTASALGP